MKMSYSASALLALLVHVIIHFNVIRNTHYRKDRPAAKAYRGLILSVMAFYGFDALWGVLYDAHLIQAVAFDTMLYFLAMAATVFFWTRFVFRYLQEENRFLRVVSWMGWLMLVFMAGILILNLFVPVMFWFDADGTYHAGAMRYLILFIQVLLFLSTSAYVFLTVGNREMKAKLHHHAIGAFGVTMSVMVVLQVLYPLLPLYAVGCLLGTCIIHTFVINDMKDDRRIELEAQLLRDKQQQEKLGNAQHMAYTDSLTGVKNTHAYVETVKRVDRRIASGEIQAFGVIVFDLNGLKHVNDTQGHEAGDALIRSACRLICVQFKHSPVFRIGGDEFVAFLEGEDYENRDALLAAFDARIEQNLRSGNVVVASGLSVFREGHDRSYRRVFERADQRMYDRKGHLKAMEK